MSSKPNLRPDSPPNGGELLKVVGLALLVCSLSGCAWSHSLFDRNPYADSATCHLPPGTDGQVIVERLNQRAEKHASWRAANAQVHYKGPEGSHTLTAHL